MRNFIFKPESSLISNQASSNLPLSRGSLNSEHGVSKVSIYRTLLHDRLLLNCNRIIFKRYPFYVLLYLFCPFMFLVFSAISIISRRWETLSQLTPITGYLLLGTLSLGEEINSFEGYPVYRPRSILKIMESIKITSSREMNSFEG